jgi:hypothetical protein
MDRASFKFHSLGIAGFLAAIALFGAAVMFLWNALMPVVFGLPPLNYWQAAGILLLARILFGSGAFGGARRLAGGMSRAAGGRDFLRGNKLRERWMHMTAEERGDFMKKQQSFHAFFGGNHPFHRQDFWDNLDKNSKDEDTKKETPNE